MRFRISKLDTVFQIRIPDPNSEILPFRELETFSRALLAVLLAFLNSGIASDQTGMFQSRSKIGVEFHQRSSDAVTNRASLTGRAAALDVDNQSNLVDRFGQLQWLTNNHAQGFVRKITIKRLVD